MNDDLLKQGGGYFEELLERIRDIRSSEKIFYRKVLEIYATSIDYDPHAKITKKFFQKQYRTKYIGLRTAIQQQKLFIKEPMLNYLLWD